MIDITNYNIKDYSLNQGGCLALALAVVESAFDDTRRGKHDCKLSRKLNRAFLDSQFVAAAIDCTDTHEVGRLLKQFDKIK